MATNLLRVEKPKGKMTRSNDKPIEVRGHTMVGYYDEADNYYEYDKTDKQWFLLIPINS